MASPSLNSTTTPMGCSMGSPTLFGPPALPDEGRDLVTRVDHALDIPPIVVEVLEEHGGKLPEAVVSRVGLILDPSSVHPPHDVRPRIAKVAFHPFAVESFHSREKSVDVLLRHRPPSIPQRTARGRLATYTDIRQSSWSCEHPLGLQTVVQPGRSVATRHDWRENWRADGPGTRNAPHSRGVSEHRYRDSNPGFRRERAAS
jgi:hypothetical protein